MGSILNIDAGTWEQQVLQSDKLTAVEFWHEHCEWCRKFEPLLEEASEEYKGRIKFAKLNILRSPSDRQIAAKHGVMGTPTLVLFCAGRPIEQIAGFMLIERLKKTLDDALGKYKECLAQSTELPRTP
jgi:thioredoxin 1